MSYTKKDLRQHPGANPYRGQHGQRGQFLGLTKTRVLRLFDASRWIPHVGEKELAKYATPAPHRLGGEG